VDDGRRILKSLVSARMERPYKSTIGFFHSLNRANGSVRWPKAQAAGTD
jgi:hypothetical protein